MFLLHNAGFDQADGVVFDALQLGALCWKPSHAAWCHEVVVATPAQCCPRAAPASRDPSTRQQEISPATGTLSELPRQGF